MFRCFIFIFSALALSACGQSSQSKAREFQLGPPQYAAPSQVQIKAAYRKALEDRFSLNKDQAKPGMRPDGEQSYKDYKKALKQIKLESCAWSEMDSDARGSANSVMYGFEDQRSGYTCKVQFKLREGRDYRHEDAKLALLKRGDNWYYTMYWALTDPAREIYKIRMDGFPEVRHLARPEAYDKRFIDPSEIKDIEDLKAKMRNQG